mmetsp:Transcript_38955/g.62791  ORF Transcript_38955/g.62791 Transcript_38955/m.62791 type:complete len:142 (-) Transcript_38955:2092-2517(-)
MKESLCGTLERDKSLLALCQLGLGTRGSLRHSEIDKRTLKYGVMYLICSCFALATRLPVAPHQVLKETVLAAVGTLIGLEPHSLDALLPRQLDVFIVVVDQQHLTGIHNVKSIACLVVLSAYVLYVVTLPKTGGRKPITRA